MSGGRPSKYKPEYVEQAQKLATLGATDREAAEFFDVNEATLHRWKHEHPEFCESLKGRLVKCTRARSRRRRTLSFRRP